MKLQDNRYFKEAKLMLETIPSVATEECFALKRVASRITKLRPSVQAGHVFLPKTKHVIKLTVTEKDVQIKIEPNLVLRGSIFPTRSRDTTEKVEEAFKMAASINTVSDADLYGGKICAALDRQHPRDLFDVKVLLENEGITDEIRKGFVYLAGHDETMSELLDPKKKDIRQSYEEEFEGMPFEKVEFKALLNTRDQLIASITKDLTENERKFLLSIKEGAPN